MICKLIWMFAWAVHYCLCTYARSNFEVPAEWPSRILQSVDTRSPEQMSHPQCENKAAMRQPRLASHHPAALPGMRTSRQQAACWVPWLTLHPWFSTLLCLYVWRLQESPWAVLSPEYFTFCAVRLGHSRVFVVHTSSGPLFALETLVYVKNIWLWGHTRTVVPGRGRERAKRGPLNIPFLDYAKTPDTRYWYWGRG